jgi:hypothetical protein
MIYLIDDSKLEEYNAEYVFDEKYKNILTVVRNDSEFSKVSEELTNACCIMVHNTFCKSQNTKKECSRIAQYGEKIPLIIFSAGDSENAVMSTSKNAIVALKKSVFYNRLKVFLDTYLKDNLINLKLIAYGKDYVKVEIRNLSKNIFSAISGEEGVMNVFSLARIAKDTKKLVTLSSPKIGVSYEDLMKKLKSTPTTFACFRNNINNIVISFEQYGKNIYTWK